MNRRLDPEVAEALYNGEIAIRIPDDPDEAMEFLRILADTTAMRWENGKRLTEFNPRQKRHGIGSPNCYCAIPNWEPGLIADTFDNIRKYIRKGAVKVYLEVRDAYVPDHSCPNLVDKFLSPRKARCLPFFNLHAVTRKCRMLPRTSV